MSVYLLLDTQNRNYPQVVESLRKRGHSTFQPVVSNRGDKALIQIKDSHPVYEKWMLDRKNPVLLGSGDLDWAKEQLETGDWDEAKERPRRRP